MQPTITITKAAVSYIKKMIEKKQGIGFRLSIKKTGCSGFSYAPSIVDQPKTTDIALEVSELRVFLDAAWIDLLQDLQVDYVEEDKTGLKQKRLVFSNPKEASRCGCGESFQVENMLLSRNAMSTLK